MNAKQFKDKFVIGEVTLTPKAKSCGKENCGACPHPGYWYASVPAQSAVNGQREEIYLGQRWDAAELKTKVAPRLRAPFREQFIGEVQATLDGERLNEVTAEIQRTERQRTEAVKDHALQLKRQQQQHQSYIKRLNDHARTLEQERKTLTRKLKKAKA